MPNYIREFTITYSASRLYGVSNADHLAPTGFEIVDFRLVKPGETYLDITSHGIIRQPTLDSMVGTNLPAPESPRLIVRRLSKRMVVEAVEAAPSHTTLYDDEGKAVSTNLLCGQGYWWKEVK